MVRAEGILSGSGQQQTAANRIKAGNTKGASQEIDPRAILNSLGEVVYDWDVVTDKLRWGPNLADVLGAAVVPLLKTGTLFGHHVTPDSPRSRHDAITAACLEDQGQGVAFQTQYGLFLPDQTSKDGETTQIWIEDKGRVFAGPDQRPMRVHGLMRVIPARFHAERGGRLASIFDPLTGALHRKPFSERLSRNFIERNRERSGFAVMMINVQNLDKINKTHGYDVGDDLMVGIAERIRSNLRSGDAMGRFSGSRFALLLDSCEEEQLTQAAQRLLQSIGSSPFATSAGPMSGAIAIGASLAPKLARSANVLLRQAESALEQSMHKPACGAVIFDILQTQDEKRARSARIADEIIAALNQRRIVLALQPIVHAATGKPHFFEALMRLRSPDGTIMSPGHVLPVAEEAGLISFIDHRILELSLAQLSANPQLQIAINASSKTLADGGWPRHLAGALALNPGCASRLMIEITETSAIEDVDATCAVVKAMKDLGVKVAMDDFGAGHTSFRNLRKLNIDLLKIDGAFMPNLITSADDRYFVRTMVDLAHHLGIPVVAEWVEKPDTAQLLADWGVDFLQGFLYGQAELAPELAVQAATLARFG